MTHYYTVNILDLIQQAAEAVRPFAVNTVATYYSDQYSDTWSEAQSQAQEQYLQ